jgi:ATP-dependent DNA helicase PIF1
MEHTFDEEQGAAYDALVNTDESILLTGVAGCGKSTIIRKFLETRGDRGNIMVCAPTGVAALNIGGATIHRAFGLTPRTDLENPGVSLKVKSTLYWVDTIVIDEASMVRADLLNALNIIMKRVKHSSEPFGGVRMIFVGDFYQLPPVVKREEEDYLEQRHGSRTGWMFFAPCFKALSPRVFFLNKSYRQAEDGSFTSLLNRVRNVDLSVVAELNAIARPANTAGEAVPRLCARKKSVDHYNGIGLQQNGVQPTAVYPLMRGDVNKIPFEEQSALWLAEGARVMCTRNGNGYVNGSLGTLTSFNGEATLWNGEVVPAMIVRLDKGYDVAVPRETKEILGYEADNDGKLHKVVIADVSQLPLQLGYGWTIHKSQGQTLDAAVIDLGGGAFAHGQTYVGLSRVTSAAGLYLQGQLRADDLLLDTDVLHYFRSLS